jgi:hypothetical protein
MWYYKYHITYYMIAGAQSDTDLEQSYPLWTSTPCGSNGIFQPTKRGSVLSLIVAPLERLPTTWSENDLSFRLR